MFKNMYSKLCVQACATMCNTQNQPSQILKVISMQKHTHAPGWNVTLSPLTCLLVLYTSVFGNCSLSEMERISARSITAWQARWYVAFRCQSAVGIGVLISQADIKVIYSRCLYSLALPCEHSQARKTKGPLWDTHLILKSSAASLALSISSMMRAFSSVLFRTLAWREVW